MNSDYSLSDIAAVSGGGNSGFGGGNGAWWIIILFLFAFMNGGWGGNYGGGGMNGGVGSEVQRGFDHSSVVTKLDGISHGICDSTYALSNAITSGFSSAELSRCNQQAMLMQQLNSMQASAQDCCCQTQRAIDSLNYNMATQACDTRHAIQDSTRQILDFLTTDKISSLQAENTALKTQNFFSANQEAQTAELLRRLLPPTPVPAWDVPNPYASYGYGCGRGC